ncbi:MAG: DUF3108 domain-containing protein [Alphaproteobacteria bacterium]|nr:DUF3108 domain-containing protein [Alphaproteobacteria bacterium]
MMRKIAAITIGLLLALTHWAQAGERHEYPFEIRANGFRFGDFLVVLEEDAQTYRVEVSAEARGVFGFMLRARYSGTSTGEKRPDGTRLGLDFKARSSRIFADRTQQVTYQDGQPKTVFILPLKRRTALSDPLKVTGSFNDPLSFLANLVANPGTTCPAPADLYDGRRITKVTLEPGLPEPNSLTCTGTYEIIEGPDHSLQKGVRRFGLTASYGRDLTGILLLKSVKFESGGNEILLSRLGN